MNNYQFYDCGYPTLEILYYYDIQHVMGYSLKGLYCWILQRNLCLQKQVLSTAFPIPQNIYGGSLGQVKGNWII